MRCRRTLTAITLAVVAMGGLTACQTKIGQAAAVEGATLSDSDLSSYLKPGTGPYTDQVEPAGRAQVARPDDLDPHRAAQRRDRRARRRRDDAGAQRRARGDRSHQRHRAAGRAELAKYGYETKFGDLLFDETVRLVVLVERLAKGASATQALQALQQSSQVNQAIGGAIAKFTKKVELSPRYGTWDPAKVKVSDTKSGAPDFVKLGG